MFTLFLGLPGSGKGTLANMLVERKNVKTLSTGIIFRDLVNSDSELSLKLKQILNSGNLVPDELTNEIFVDYLETNKLKNERLILDGYPRTIKQGFFLDSYLNKENAKIEKIVYLKIDENLILNRLVSRLYCPKCGQTYNSNFAKPKLEGKCNNCGTDLQRRKDDDRDVISKRIKEYKDQTFPLIEFYKKNNRLITIDVSGTVEDNYSILVKEIDK